MVIDEQAAGLDGAAAAGDQQPRMVIRCGWPRDLLSWITAAPSLLFFGGILGIFAGGGVVVMVNLLSDQFGVSLIAGAAGFGTMLCLWAREEFGVTGETHEFYQDRMVSRLRRVVWRRRDALDTVQIAYDRIGTIRLLRGGRLQVHFGIPTLKHRTSCLIHLPKLSAADQFEAIIEWIEEARPRHLFLAESPQQRHYSRPWRLAERYPDLGAVAGEAKIDRLNETGHLRAGGAGFDLGFQGFTVITVSPSPPDGGDTAPIMAATSEFAAGLVTPEIRIIDHTGMLLATSALPGDRPVAPGHLALGFAIDRRLEWHYRSGKIRIDDRLAGVIRPTAGAGATLELVRATPLAEVLLVFLVVGLSRHHLDVEAAGGTG